MLTRWCCDAVVAWPSQIGRKRREYRSVGKQLGLGIVPHHVDDRGPRDWPSLHRPPTAEYPVSGRNSESPNKVTPQTHSLNCPHRCSRFASSRSTRNRGWAVGGGILVAWRSRIAFRGNSLLRRLNFHARRFGADAGTPLAYDGRAGSNGRNAIVWHKHCLHLRSDARILAYYDPAPPVSAGRNKISSSPVAARPRWFICLGGGRGSRFGSGRILARMPFSIFMRGESG